MLNLRAWLIVNASPADLIVEYYEVDMQGMQIKDKLIHLILAEVVEGIEAACENEHVAMLDFTLVVLCGVELIDCLV